MSGLRFDPMVGVLAVQGDFSEHQAALASVGVASRQVRVPADLEGVEGLILPGGESTTMLKLLELQGLSGPLAERIAEGLPVLATCAGLILLASEVVEPAQASFGVLDITTARNGYGRQIHSGTFPLEGEAAPKGATGVFIRAPRILRAGPQVEVLASWNGDPVLVRQGPVLGACFHPELQPGHFVTDMFCSLLRAAHDPSV